MVLSLFEPHPTIQIPSQQPFVTAAFAKPQQKWNSSGSARFFLSVISSVRPSVSAQDHRSVTIIMVVTIIVVTVVTVVVDVVNRILSVFRVWSFQSSFLILLHPMV